MALASVAHLSGVLSHEPKGRGFDSLIVGLISGQGMYEKATNGCSSHSDVPLSLSLPPSLPPAHV